MLVKSRLQSTTKNGKTASLENERRACLATRQSPIHLKPPGNFWPPKCLSQLGSRLEWMAGMKFHPKILGLQNAFPNSAVAWSGWLEQNWALKFLASKCLSQLGSRLEWMPGATLGFKISGLQNASPNSAVA